MRFSSGSMIVKMIFPIISINLKQWFFMIGKIKYAPGTFASLAACLLFIILTEGAHAYLML